MLLYAIFLILIIQLGHIYASPPSPDALEPRIKGNKKGYECGNIFFFENQIEKAKSHIRDLTSIGYKLPRTYKGDVFGESNSKDYYLWPIDENGSLIPSNKKTKNGDGQGSVVAKTKANGYIKCIRWDILPEEPSSSNGYLCGQSFFHSETIDDNIALAKQQPEGKSGFPSPYTGTLYSKDSRYLIWPIQGGIILHTTKTYKAKELVGVVVEGHNNFIRCPKSIMPHYASAPDQNSELSVPLSTFRYKCRNIYFHTGDLEKIAESVKDDAFFKVRAKFPSKHEGAPYYQTYLKWPLLINGKNFISGPPGNYRLILTPDYGVIGVAMIDKDNIFRPCLRIPIRPKIYLDTSDYECLGKNFTHQHLAMAAEEACQKFGNKLNYRYPARYEGSPFKVVGPYFTYPLFQHVVFQRDPGRYRVVVNSNCEIAGVLTPPLPSINIDRLSYDNTNSYMKCHRSVNGLLPETFFSTTAEIVIEH